MYEILEDLLRLSRTGNKYFKILNSVLAYMYMYMYVVIAILCQVPNYTYYN